MDFATGHVVEHNEISLGEKGPCLVVMSAAQGIIIPFLLSSWFRDNDDDGKGFKMADLMLHGKKSKGSSTAAVHCKQASSKRQLRTKRIRWSLKPQPQTIGKKGKLALGRNWTLILGENRVIYLGRQPFSLADTISRQTSYHGQQF